MGIYPIVAPQAQSVAGAVLQGNTKNESPDMIAMVKNLMGSGKEEEKGTGMISGIKEKMAHANIQKKHEDYEAMRKAEEARRRKRVVEQKKRAKTML